MKKTPLISKGFKDANLGTKQQMSDIILRMCAGIFFPNHCLILLPYIKLIKIFYLIDQRL